jgi:RNA polymerase sigma factor (TIGR02999 family)
MKASSNAAEVAAEVPTKTPADMPASVPVTQLLHDVEQGKPHAAQALLPLVYEQLRDLARHRMAEERAGHTLQATALVHEAFLRLVGDRPAGWAGRAHFFHAAAEAMRRILIEHARARGRVKRGGGAERQRVPLSVVDLATESDPGEILDLDEAICRLDQQSPDVAAVVRLRFYAGLTIEETAEALGISPQSVKRDWAYARAWLFHQLGY